MIWTYSSAAEVQFGPVLGPLNANPEPDHWSGSGNEGECRTGPLRMHSNIQTLCIDSKKNAGNT
jgi:hypothetical protein